MIKILILLLITGIISSCNLMPNSMNEEPVNVIDSVQHHHESKGKELVLNGHAKWKSDSVTNNNVDNLTTVISDIYKVGLNTLPNYQKAAVDIQKTIDKMINECRMKGPDHDALHRWLQPLLKRVTDFKQFSLTSGAAEKLEGISKQVNLYYQYFE